MNLQELSNIHYTNSDHSTWAATYGSSTISGSVSVKNRVWRMIEKSGLKVAPYVPPVVPVTYTPEEFFNLFTEDEWLAVDAAAQEDQKIRWLMARLQVRRSPIRSDSQGLKDGLNHLVNKGLVSRDKVQIILSDKVDP